MEEKDKEQQKQEEQLATDPSTSSGQAADSQDQEQHTSENKEQNASEQLEANSEEQGEADQPEVREEQQEQLEAGPSTNSPRPSSGQAGQAAESEGQTFPEQPNNSDQDIQEEQPEATSEEQSATEPSDAPSEEADPETSHPCHGSAEGSSDGVRTALVSIRGQNRTAHFNAGEHSLVVGDEVVIQTEQGKNIGVVMEPPVTLACRGCKNLKILRKANPEEIARDEENRELEKKAFDYCTKTIEEWEIPMRLVQVEFLLDRSKAIFFFTAEKRVDFRELVRTLAREFSTRIEMRQIGIRDEARLLGGVGPCGMAFCCSTFLKEFAPISVKMAKEQNVILNPNKISGGCGRLLCCLNYEYDMYKEASKGVPKVGKKVNLPEGAGKVRSVDIFARTVTIDLPEEKKNIVMDIDELLEKLK